VVYVREVGVRARLCVVRVGDVLCQAVDVVRVPACRCVAGGRRVGEGVLQVQESSHAHGPEPRSQGVDVVVVRTRGVRRVGRRC
jgi:hypothetical protein